MEKHTADALLKRFLFWQQATQTAEGDDRRNAVSRFRGFVEACGVTLGLQPAASEADDALHVFDCLRAASAGPGKMVALFAGANG